MGPLVAGRLQNGAEQIAAKLRLRRPDGLFDIGDSAVVRLSVDEVRGPANPQVIFQGATESGVQALCSKLKEAYGTQEQDRATVAFDAFLTIGDPNRHCKSTRFSVSISTRMLTKPLAL